MVETRTSFCRLCHNLCGVEVEVTDGRLTRVTGDRKSPLYQGYTCTKGRGQPAVYNDPDRLRRSLKRDRSGQLQPIASDLAISEIANRLRQIVEEHGPRSIALYLGTYAYITHPATTLIANGLMDAIGSQMRFTPATIDQPGKALATGFHGAWMAPSQKFDDIDALMIIGGNPLVSYLGFPMGNPGTFLKDFQRRAGQLVVIDPRRTDIARRAQLYIQPVPGEDVAILAGILRAILVEGRQDQAFLDENATGVDELRCAVEPFTPEFVARRAGIAGDDVISAARIFGGARRASCSVGTGPNMSGRGTLIEYLVLCLHTVCGRWLRSGERARGAPTWMPSAAQAQAIPPFPAYGYGEQLSVRGLTDTLSGLPTAAAADEMLLEGQGRIRALLSCGGNPMLAWPDQIRTRNAFEQLDLLVQVDTSMSATAEMADYVIAAKRAFEMPGFNVLADISGLSPNMGLLDSFAQATAAVVEPPPESDLVEDWEVFYGLAQQMELPCNLGPAYMIPLPSGPLDMTKKPTNDELFEMMTAGARVRLEDVVAHPHGLLLNGPDITVADKDPGWTGRLDVGSPEMMRDLSEVAASGSWAVEGFAYRLVSRRSPNVYNTASDDPPRARMHNPAFMHSSDVAALGIGPGARVTIRSPRAAVEAVIEIDDSMRPGVISMSHGHGSSPGGQGDVTHAGTSTARLIDNGGV
ncbi:MAG: molybdopterin-containing oxidoreductase family protein [Acidimicrobiales bacterium]